MSDKSLMSVGLAHQLDYAFRRHDWSTDEINRLSQGDILADVREVMRGHAEICLTGERIFIITVNYDRVSTKEGFEALIDAGHYDWRNDDLNFKKFPVKGTGTRHFECCLLPADCSSRAGVQRVKEAGFIAAETEHILAFGKAYPDEQRKHPIAGLGSSAQVYGYHSVPCLFRHGRGRHLGLSGRDGAWPDDWRLLAVREIYGPAT